MIDIEKKAQEIADDVVKKTRQEAAAMLELARDKAPEQTGALKRSGRVADLADGARLEFTADYAPDVHENPASSGHKFLENAAKELGNEFADRVADGVRHG